MKPIHNIAFAFFTLSTAVQAYATDREINCAVTKGAAAVRDIKELRMSLTGTQGIIAISHRLTPSAPPAQSNVIVQRTGSGEAFFWGDEQQVFSSQAKVVEGLRVRATTTTERVYLVSDAIRGSEEKNWSLVKYQSVEDLYCVPNEDQDCRAHSKAVESTSISCADSQDQNLHLADGEKRSEEPYHP
ncbi:MAG: hypothetical protein H7301_06460 [Cryobacterium sp.]|nr:hypothetical protein [Oligoflexia bacterium]